MMTLSQYNEALNALESVIKHVSKTIPYQASLEAPSSFRGIKDFYVKNGYFLIYSGASETTIFSSPEINVMFRAIHDKGHFDHDLSFMFSDEKRLGEIQSNELMWTALILGYNLSVAKRVKTIIQAEIIGQIEYYEITGKYLDNQKEYIMKYLNVA